MGWEWRVIRGVGQIAQVLEVSQRTVRRWIKAGYLPARMMGGSWTITTKELDEWREMAPRK